MTPQFAVFGHPVAHSLSPHIHARFGRQFGLDVDYHAIDAAPADFVRMLGEFRDGGGIGANVTLPLKEAAFALCRSQGERARRAGAVNTLIRDGKDWHGENTDGIGLVNDLAGRHGLDLREWRTLLLGAGGAARGVAPALLDAGIGELTIVNRTPARADALADALGEPARVLTRCWADLPRLGDFDLIVNATSAAHAGVMPELHGGLANRRSAAVDLGYGEVAIGFLAWARAAGCLIAVNGLGMLVEQAAESFRLWHGQRPDTDPVFAELQARQRVPRTAD
ncbi:MAG: shikimate dehydrogenase [Pseudoxanthomonas suwonensis]|nr:shikimate dehydrogenase [Pseudoxanthomonas suwonensis]